MARRHNSDKHFSLILLITEKNKNQSTDRKSTDLWLTKNLQVSEMAAFCFYVETKSL